jgi:SAM-dependent methyltransferase
MTGINATHSGLTEHLGDQVRHAARVVALEPLTVSTGPAQWAYALSYRLIAALLTDDGTLTSDLRCVLELSVASGRIGVGWTNPEDTAFIDERFVAGQGNRVAFTLRTGTRVGRLMFRNVAPGGVASVFSITAAHTEIVTGDRKTYPVAVSWRNVSHEPVPHDGHERLVFDTDAAYAINAARIEWLERANLPVGGGRVLDVGCGVGHFIPFYLNRGCTVNALDGRAENIAELKRRRLDIEADVADVQELDPERFGTFDVIHCFGLLYHLDSPVAALRRFSAMCKRLLIVETMVCDTSEPVMVLVDETKAASQAMDGLGCRPSPAFLAVALNRAGFDYVYGAANVPDHPDFQFEWKNNRETIRNGIPLRCIIVASKAPLELPSLVPLLER